MVIETINKDICPFYKNQDVDFIKLLKYKGENKLSITAKYESLGYEFINANNEKVNLDDFYYGLHPSFDNYIIKQIVTKRMFKNRDDLDLFVRSKLNLFHMYEGQEKYLIPLYKKTILEATHKFGIKIILESNSIKPIIEGKFKEFKNKLFKLEKEDTLYLLGSIQDETIKMFNGLGLYFNYVNKEIILSSNNDYPFNFNDEEIMTKHYKLCFGNSFYSGVMLKLMKITETDNLFSNEKIKQIVLNVHRTTFFTEDAFDSKKQDENNLLTDRDKRRIKEFFNKENEKQLNVMEKDDVKIDDINVYLKDSMFTNIIGVTSNVVTSDNKLILGHRSKSVADADTIYPSANGHAEFLDSHVNFYKESVYEDQPSLTASDNRRIDFHGEIEREVNAELNITNFKGTWEYLGLSVLGIKPNPSKEFRRFHFNVLLKNDLVQTSKEVIDAQKLATEEFENQKLYMLTLNVYKNYFQRLSFWFKKGITLINNNRSIILLLATIISFMVYGYKIGSRQEDIVSYTNYAFYIITIIVFGMTIFFWSLDFYKYKKNMKKINHVNINSKDNNIANIIAKTTKKLSSREKKAIMHPITLLMYRIYLEEKI